jgi:hypothetical protein
MSRSEGGLRVLSGAEGSYAAVYFMAENKLGVSVEMEPDTGTRPRVRVTRLR